MKRLTILDLKPNGRQLLPDILGAAKITGGGIYVFKSGETAKMRIAPGEQALIDIAPNPSLPLP